jgi:radical SAM protein with 4Fe4S-binding SPASM domain
MKKNFNGVYLEKFYKKTMIPKVHYLKLKFPFSVQFELTSGCNQKCIFCYNVWKENCSTSLTNKSLSKEDHFKIIDILTKNEIFDIIFSGGEPLLIEWLEELIKKVSKKNIESMIITNGILLTKKRAVSLKKSGLNSIQISLHHYLEKTNNFLVGKNTFKKSLFGIKNALRVFGRDNINVNMVALPETSNDVYEMAKFLHSIGVDSFSVGSPSATGEMSKNKSLVINKIFFLNIYNQLKKAKKDFGINVSFTGGFPFCILPEINKESIDMISNCCDAGLVQLVISPKGDIRACVCLNQNLGNILKDDSKEIWKKNEFLLNLRKLKYLPKECRRCKYVSICRGGCRASAFSYYGNINAKDPLMN